MTSREKIKPAFFKKTHFFVFYTFGDSLGSVLFFRNRDVTLEAVTCHNVIECDEGSGSGGGEGSKEAKHVVIVKRSLNNTYNFS